MFFRVLVVQRTQEFVLRGRRSFVGAMIDLRCVVTLLDGRCARRGRRCAPIVRLFRIGAGTGDTIVGARIGAAFSGSGGLLSVMALGFRIGGVKSIRSRAVRRRRLPVAATFRRVGVRRLIGRWIDAGVRTFQLVFMTGHRRVDFFRWFGIARFPRIWTIWLRGVERIDRRSLVGRADWFGGRAFRLGILAMATMRRAFNRLFSRRGCSEVRTSRIVLGARLILESPNMSTSALGG